MSRTPTRMPVLFVAHGSPLLLDDAAWVDELRAWALAVPRPASILMISAHWERAPVTIGATKPVPLIRDFSGFPEKHYRVPYPCPGAPALADRVRTILGPTHVDDEPERGLDHGAYVPLVAMYPDADVPVLQISLPTLEPAPLLELGRKLAPLRDEGTLIVGSGFLTHNLRAIDWSGGPPPEWAVAFDAWAAAAISKHDTQELSQYRARGPGVRESLPTSEHFAPIFVVMGASDSSEPVRFPIIGFDLGSMTRRSVQVG